MQAAVAVCLIALSRLDPAQQLWWVALWAVLLAFASATQDVAIDALRIEQFRAEEARKVSRPARRCTSPAGGPATASAAASRCGWWSGCSRRALTRRGNRATCC